MDNNFFDTMVFEKKCIICNSQISKFELLCDSCKNKAIYYENKNLSSELNSYDDIYCLFKYEGNIKSAIYNIKKNHETELLYEFGKMLKTKLKVEKEIDMITYVPTNFKKMLERGYNQSQLLGKIVAGYMDVNCKKVISRKFKINDKEIKKLSKQKRFSEVENRFYLKEEYIVNDKNILLVDDVTTTGATLNVCSELLKKAGASKVVCAVIATGRN